MQRINCLIFIILAVCIQSAESEPQDTLIGFIPKNQHVAIPNLILNSSSISASDCTDTCGIFSYSYSVIWNNTCTCTDDLLMSTKVSISCDKKMPCTGNKSEYCGCANKSQAIVYFTGNPMLYSLTINSSGSGYQNFIASIFITMFGPMMRESREIQLNSVTIVPGMTIQSTVSDRDLKSIEMVRIGHNGSGNWSVTQISILNVTGGSIYNFFACSTLVGDEINNVVHISSNGTCSSPIQGNGYYSPGKNSFSCVICDKGDSQTSDCSHIKSQLTGQYGLVNCIGYFYDRTIKFENLHSTVKSDCDPFPPPLAGVSSAKMSSSSGTGSYMQFTCLIGYFKQYTAKNGSQILQTTFQNTCQPNGTWSPPSLPNCIPACLTAPPAAGSQLVMTDRVDQSYYDNGTAYRYCCTAGPFYGYTSNLITDVCVNGTWSLNVIPSCSSTAPADQYSGTQNKGVQGQSYQKQKMNNPTTQQTQAAPQMVNCIDFSSLIFINERMCFSAL